MFQRMLQVGNSGSGGGGSMKINQILPTGTVNFNYTADEKGMYLVNFTFQKNLGTDSHEVRINKNGTIYRGARFSENRANFCNLLTIIELNANDTVNITDDMSVYTDANLTSYIEIVKL